MNESKQVPPPQERKGSGWWMATRIFIYTILWLVLFGILSGLVAVGAVGGYVAALVKDDPVRPQSLIEEKINANAITGFVYFRDNTLIGQLRTEEDRQPVTYDQIPQTVIDAVTSIEDHNFFNHIGIDMNGLLRAVKQQLLNEDVQTGGSTLTQQLARQVFLTLDKTTSRKAKEIFLALRLEQYLSKDEIITAYLNKINYGNGSSGYTLYGIKAAARGIFGLELNQLNLAQSAYLAGVPQLPSTYSAFTSKGEFRESGFNAALKRQKLVLEKMLEYGKITQAQYDEAISFDLYASLAKPTEKAYNTYPYLMLEAEREAAQLLVLKNNPDMTMEDLNKSENAALVEEAREQLLRGGYKVTTTIDKTVYDLMHEIAEDPDNFTPDNKTKGVEQTAAVMLDQKTGAILGMIEGRDFHIEQMNFATQMTRQPGSAMKPIAAYLPALDKGLISPASVLDDSPIILNNGGTSKHIPKNSNNRYSGLVTARTALAQSLNIPALKVYLDKVTIPEALAFARKMGITTLVEQDYQAQTGVIGGLTYGVSVEELTGAYGAIGNKGVLNEPYLIEEIVDAKGEDVYKHEPNPQRVASEQSAYLMTDMLKSVIQEGTATSLKSLFKGYGKIPFVGKTGTTQNYSDVWFEGYTPDITLGVWTGYEKSIYTLSTAGHNRSKEIWAKIMNAVTEAKPELFPTESFEKPDDIVSMTVSSVSGKLPTDLTREAGKLTTDIFNKKYIPTEQDDSLVKVKYITYNGVNYLPQPGTPEDLMRESVMVKREKPLDELMEEIEAALPNVSADARKPLSYYLPTDAKASAPSKLDPRTEDGRTPTAPGNPAVELLDGLARITFTPSPEADVAGYRLYRSVSGGSFQKVEASVFAGDEPKFVNYISASNQYQYYVTAVDVAGNESSPSSVVHVGGGDGDLIDPTLPLPGGDIGGGTDGTGGTGGAAPPEGTQAVPSVPTGLSGQGEPTGVTLSWSANPAADKVSKYEVWYSPNNDDFTLLGSTESTSFNYPTVSPAGWYRVTAVNAAGSSSPSGKIQIN
ncbi:penicillin-binding protein 1A [Cohnella lubricantis]|uniref:Transglycosylase domain-containing protein n=1 Tax=Cohnella lubricantis TaxID=2163172 RepID=A0A841TFI9_9BACL|nr:penicillin-binding protein 1A [Cohnella lubricantis]MBB6677241.1 transglycosylase domain-containing protein [Cohnella lubricantis]MBP2116948.1 penicillin-binding protein [Cohnella lubricantis]